MALEHYFYQEAVDADELKEFILRAVISDLEDEGMESTVEALLKAYWILAEAEDDEVKAFDGKETEDFYRKVYVKAFNARIPDYLDEDDPEVSWAEALPIYKSGTGYEKTKLFPLWLVKTAALAAAQRDVANLKAFSAYSKAVETPGTPEHEDLKKTYGEERAAEVLANAEARKADNSEASK